jgi:hypothetical protein
MASTNAFSFGLCLDILYYWCWLACTMPAACCWACLTTCCWVGVTVFCYSLSFPWCILHVAKSILHLAMAAYCHKHRLSLSPQSQPMPPYQQGEETTAAAPSRPASPLAEQQHPERPEADAPAATTATDSSSPVRGKAGTKPTRAAPTRSDDGQGLQDTAAAAAAAGPSTAPAQQPAQAPAAAEPETSYDLTPRELQLKYKAAVLKYNAPGYEYVEPQPKDFNKSWLVMHQIVANFNRQGRNDW